MSSSSVSLKCGIVPPVIELDSSSEVAAKSMLETDDFDVAGKWCCDANELLNLSSNALCSARAFSTSVVVVVDVVGIEVGGCGNGKAFLADAHR